jgi:two-component system CheB/CheR fusion protein
VERRLLLHRYATLDAYIERLHADGREIDSLYQDLLIGVTRFFRDADAFRKLEELLPALIERLSPEEELRVWVAGCATGEEAYSIAILVVEAFEKAGRSINAKIFATDVHQSSLELAAAARYPEDRVSGMTDTRLARFFAREGDSYRVVQDVRQMVVFAQHNLIKDAPFTRIHLATCRNLLIYLQPHAQRKVVALFHFGLTKDGVLFLGSSETPGTYREDFEVLDERWRIYRKHRDLRLPDFPLMPAQPRVSTLALPRESQEITVGNLLGAYDALLERFMPASFLVSQGRRLLHTFGGAGKYLRVGDGRPSGDFLDLVLPELRVALNGAFQRAAKDLTPVSYRQDDTAIEINPIHDRRSNAIYLLVTIGATEPREQPSLPEIETSHLELDELSRGEIGRLEVELRYTKENLQATIEELETSNEELQATNEELVASNEELQSTNEELQSVNEELYTVNGEFQRKIAELTLLTNDMDNLLESTEVGTIFLDRALTIRKFTPKIAETFSLLAQDVGRSIDSFAHNIEYEGLFGEVVRVRDTGEAFERDVRDRMGRWHFLRLLPYRTKGVVDGVVLTLIDISSLKRAENELFRERYLLRSLMDSVPDLIEFKDARGRYVRINRALASRLSLDSPEEAVGKTELELDEAAYAASALMEDQRIMSTGVPVTNKLQQRRWRSGDEDWFLTTKFPLFDTDGQRVVGTLGVHRNITRQKEAEDQARESVRRRDEFMAMLSHELRNPLSAITTASAMLDQQAKAEGSPADAGVSRYAMRVIQRQAFQMARLLDDLLDVSRVVQNKIELRREIIDLRCIMDEVVSAARHVFEENGVRMHLDGGEEPLWVDGDAVRLQQIIVNLLNNAAKYNSTGGNAWLTLRRDQDEVFIRVKDDGIGIEPHMQAYIFEAFVQAETTLARSRGGMGLGLTLVRSIVEMHGGTVSMRSEGLGRGSEFEVRLPYVRVKQTKPAPTEPEPKKLEVSHRIVLVEDRSDSRETLRMLLEAHGYQVETASDGEEGITLITSLRPTVALVDIGLPKVDGYEVARRVRPHVGRDTRLVALTGYGQHQDREHALASGFDEHVVKPVDPEILRSMLARLT